jgi:A/G-specific adenine glycosylase
MDYGTHLKKSGVRLNTKSAHYMRQSPFEGSLRQLRGRLLRRLVDGPITKESFKKIDAKNAYSISMALQVWREKDLL